LPAPALAGLSDDSIPAIDDLRAKIILANLNSGTFLNRWQIVHRTTIPSPDCGRWQVSGVDWRQRHSFTGGGYSFAVEAHTLAFGRAEKPTWSLIVVVEHWWGSDKEVLRTTTWTRRWRAGQLHFKTEQGG
jgi:hypothetical protein